MEKVDGNLAKLISLVVIAVILGGSFIIATSIATKGFIDVKGSNSITVTGSAKQQIKSDLIVWRGSFTAQTPTMSEAYTKLKVDLDKVKSYLAGKGIKESSMVISSISTTPITEITANGTYTNNVIAYRMDQYIEISSSDVDGITKISREATELINQGVEFQSQPPQYFYTKIADLKIKMLAEATKDSKARAEQIAVNTGSQIGDLQSAKMGVFQITALYSNDVVDGGYNDTSSIDKEITAVISCNFHLKK